MKHIVLALSGPTGSGKTEWGIKLATDIGGVIIAADSRTVYTSLNIGTNKAIYEYPAVERSSSFGPIFRIKGIDHYGLNQCLPIEQYTASMFQQYVYSLLPILWEQRRIPILVGGTGLYIQAVLDGFEFPRFAKLPSEWQIRPTLDLVQELQLWDPQSAGLIDLGNRARVERALAHAFATGQSFRGEQRKRTPDFKRAVFVINPKKEELYSRLDRRLENWLDDGLLRETESLIAEGVPSDRVASLGFMYRIALERLENRIDEITLRNDLRSALRRFTKRQLTWWRRYPGVHWVTRYSEILKETKRVIKETAEC